MKKIRIKEDLKRDIARYLENAATRKDWKVENFTLSSISDSEVSYERMSCVNQQ